MATILVVDDYVVTLRILSAQLRKGGYEVITAVSGQSALEKLAQQRFDLAIIDIAMPDMDGITLLMELRSQPSHKDLPVIMLTASVLDDDRVRAQKEGATAFLTKPISSWDLLDIVRQLLAQSELSV